MSEPTDDNEAGQSRLDRPSLSVPSIDRPWEDPSERLSRQSVTHRDRARHRVYHSLYEDMLN